MFGWYHQLNGHEFEQALEGGEGQRSLACFSPWGCKESDTSVQVNNKKHLHAAGDARKDLFFNEVS